MKRLLFVAMFVFLLLVFFLSNPTGRVVEKTEFNSVGVNVGEVAEDFSLTTVEGETVNLSDFKGRTVVVSFMATWCVPCQIEAENIKKAQEYGDLVVIQIGVDPRESDQDLIKFKKRFGGEDWFIGFDKGFEISKKYVVKSFDTTIVVNSDGVIVYRDDGWPVNVNSLKSYVSYE